MNWEIYTTDAGEERERLVLYIPQIGNRNAYYL